MLSSAMRIAIAVWGRHYRIPEWRYWLGLLGGIGIAVVTLLTGIYSALFDGETFDRQFVAGLTVAAVNLILIGSSLVGIGRWRLDRRHARGGLVVPYFEEWAGAKDRGADVRAAILDALEQNLSEAERPKVHQIGAVVDLGDKKLAAQLLKTLGAQGLVHGRAVDRPGGGWTVHARLVRPAVIHITHYDWHTMDATRARMPWRAWFSRLPSTFEVSDQEFPLELTRDLAALVRALAGATGLTDSPVEAEASMREAIAKSPDSPSAAMDELRLTLAMTVFFQERYDEALDLLRGRISAGDASGELLRAFTFLAELRRRMIHAELGEIGELEGGDLAELEAEIAAEEKEDLEMLEPEQRRIAERANRQMEEAEAMLEQAYGLDGEEGNDPTESEATYAHLREVYAAIPSESIAALEMAADDEEDPRQDLSLYNLITDLLSAASEAEESEKAALRRRAWEKLDLLVERSKYYRGLWYVKRLHGVRAWMEFQAISAQQRAHSPEGVAAATEAAKWYSQAIRARPRYMRVRYEEDGPLLRNRLRSRRSPILDANAFDAHFYAGHKHRARYYEWRFQHRRLRLLRRALQDLRRGYIGFARISLDWTIVGRHEPGEGRRDALESVARAARDRIDQMGQEAHMAATEAAIKEIGELD